MTRRLLLHIGHSKTGSSYLQSTLALSQAALESAGITYPSNKNFDRAKDGKMTNGNGETMLDAVDKGDPKLLTPLHDAETVLYSAEHLMPALAKPEGVERLNQVANAHGFDEIHIYLVIRDPAEHLLSEYSQKVKGGRVLGLPRAAKYYQRPEVVRLLIEAVSLHPHIHLTVRNYRRIKADLISPFASWLNIEPDILTTPPVRVVNRTLTTDELAFQLLLNKRFGRCTNLIATPLMLELPEQKGQKPVLGSEPMRKLLARIRPDVRAVNQTLPREHRYRLPGRWRIWGLHDLRRAVRKDTVQLSGDQVEVIVNGLADEIANLRARLK